MDFKKIFNVAIIAVAVVAVYFLYTNLTRDDQFRKQFRSIEAQRDSLRHAMEDMQARTEKRDKELKELVGQNLKIIETLNDAVNRKTRISKDIQNDIKNNKNKIDSLWLIKS
jgi:hypothetical protein